MSKRVEQLRAAALENARNGVEGLPSTEETELLDNAVHPKFGMPVFSGQTRAPYALKGGGFGVTAIVATVPLGVGYIAVNVAVKHDPKKPADRNIEITAAKPQNLTFDSAAETDEFLGYVEAMCAEWIGFDDAYNSALKAIKTAYGVKSAPTAGSFERGRLVRSARIDAPSESARQ